MISFKSEQIFNLKYHHKKDLKYDSLLHKFNFTYCQFSSQELFNPRQLLCEFQDVYSYYNYACGVADTPFHITLEPDADLKKIKYHKSSLLLSSTKYNKALTI